MIQAAGRGNRHKEYPWFGKIYIVQLTNEAESLEKLPEIQEEQRAVQKLLEQFRSKPEILKKIRFVESDSDLLSVLLSGAAG